MIGCSSGYPDDEPTIASHIWGSRRERDWRAEFQGAVREANEVERILAEALGYQHYGDSNAVTLATEAAEKIKELSWEVGHREGEP